jgi:hypothetical protein
MTHPSIPFFTAAVAALLLYRILLASGIDHRLIFNVALTAAAAVFTLWAISIMRARGSG